MRRRSACLISLSLVRIRSRRVLRLIRNLPRRDLPQMKVKPRKLKVSGLPSPGRLRFSAAKRPNSISRVFSGCSERELLEPCAQCVEEAAGVMFLLEPDDEVVGIAHDDHI